MSNRSPPAERPGGPASEAATEERTLRGGHGGKSFHEEDFRQACECVSSRALSSILISGESRREEKETERPTDRERDRPMSNQSPPSEGPGGPASAPGRRGATPANPAGRPL